MRRLVTAIIHHRVIISSVLLFSLLFAGPGFALNLSEAQKLLASDGAAGDQFGVQVAIDGDTAVVGAMQDDDRGTNSGSVYVFKRTEGTWFEHQKLTASDGAAGDWFGIAIAIDGDTLAIGAQYDDDMVSNSGSVYIFTRTADSWIETQKLTASDGAPDDLFGGESTIALEGDTLLIGAFDDDDLGDNSGAVYVFTRAAGIWTQQQKLTGSDGGFRDCFGFPTRMDGNNAVIGAPCGDIAEAYVFTRTDGIWAEQQKLTASDGMIGNAFGDGVAINGHTIVIGDDNADDKGTSSGAVYVFTLTDGVWTEQQKILASDGTESDNFGFSLSLSGDFLLAGATGHDINSMRTGAAYVVRQSSGSWSELHELNASDGAQHDLFGLNVDLDDLTAIVGSLFDDDLGSMSGSVYIFDIPNPNETPTGSDVVVKPVPVDENGDPVPDAPEVSFEFDSVTGDGETTVVIIENGPPPPSGFKLIGLTGGPTYFDLETTAVFNGIIEICIDYSDMTVAGDPNKLTLAHDAGGGIWVDSTSSNDTTNRIICGMTSSLSFFAIVEVADPVTLLADLVDAVAALNAKKGIINSLDAKLDAAERALTDAVENNDVAAMNVLMSSFINATEAQRGKDISNDEADDLVGRAQEITLVLQGVTL